MYLVRCYDMTGSWRSFESKNLIEVLFWLLRDAQLNKSERFKYALYGGFNNG